MVTGEARLRPDEARAKARRMKEIANRLEEIMNNASKEIDKIDNVDTGIYQGNKNPAQLREELNSFRGKFNLTYGQITKSADDIISIANTKENI